MSILYDRCIDKVRIVIADEERASIKVDPNNHLYTYVYTYTNRAINYITRLFIKQKKYFKEYIIFSCLSQVYWRYNSLIATLLCLYTCSGFIKSLRRYIKIYWLTMQLNYLKESRLYNFGTKSAVSEILYNLHFLFTYEKMDTVFFLNTKKSAFSAVIKMFVFTNAYCAYQYVYFETRYVLCVMS